MRASVGVLLALCGLAGGPGTLHAADGVPPPGFVALFNGRDLTGWKGLEADPSKRAKMPLEQWYGAQKAADDNMRAHWKVEDGMLVFDGKGRNLCTVKDYGDFELLVDWKIRAKGDSGIYLRGSPQVQIWDPSQWNGEGSGGLYNNRKHARRPLKNADKPIGEWNSFRIKMIGDRVSVWLNDELVVDNTVMENYWEPSKPVYSIGQIELQNHGDVLWFKNIYIRELGDKPAAITPKETIHLFNGKNLDGLYTWLERSKYEDPKKVFTVEDGVLHISGDGMGYVATKDRYANYHLVVEYRWRDRTWPPRKMNAKNSGIMLHCVEPDGSFENQFMAGIEAEVIQGGTGDLLPVPGKRADGGFVLVSLTAEAVKDRKGAFIWHKGGPRNTLYLGSFHGHGHDPDWKDVLDFRGKEDLDHPGQEWNRLDVVADGGHITYRVNGTLANEAFDADPSSGKILFQSEGAEIDLRRFELQPLEKRGG